MLNWLAQKVPDRALLAFLWQRIAGTGSTSYRQPVSACSEISPVSRLLSHRSIIARRYGRSYGRTVAKPPIIVLRKPDGGFVDPAHVSPFDDCLGHHLHRIPEPWFDGLAVGVGCVWFQCCIPTHQDTSSHKAVKADTGKSYLRG